MPTTSTPIMVAAITTNCTHSGWLWLMNCGSTATMKMMPLGLVALVKNPINTRRCQGRCAWPCRWATSSALPALRHWHQPR